MPATSAGRQATSDVAGARPRALRLLIAVLALSAAFVVFRLGSSLIGTRVFLGLEWFLGQPPWALSSGGRVPTTSLSVSDQLDFFVPALEQIHDRLLLGDVAGWSSLVGGGSSLLGTPVFGVFSPGRWLFLVLPTWMAPGWSKLLELAFAATFTYLFARRLSCSRVAAALAGFVYPTTGFMIAWTNWPQVAVGSVVPMVFWSIERFVNERRVRTLVPVSLAVALLLLGGFPAVAGLTLYAAGAYCVLRLGVEHRHRLRGAARDLGLLAAAAVVGVGLSAAQLVPFAYQFLATTDLSYRDAGFFRVEPRRFLLTTIFPDSFAGNSLGVFAGQSNSIEVNTYVGSTVAVLVLVGLLDSRRRRSVRLFMGAVIAFCVTLLWFQGFWTAWLDALPILHGNPVGRVRSLLGLPVATLAAFGLDRVAAIRPADVLARLRGHLPRAETRLAAAAAPVVVVCAFGSWYVWSHRDQLSKSTGADVVVAVVPPVVILLLALLALRHQPALRVAVVALVVGVVGQATWATGFYWPTGQRGDYYRATAMHDYLSDHVGHDRVATSGPAWANTTSVYGIPTLNGHAFLPKKMHDVFSAITGTVFLSPTYTVFSAGPEVTTPGLDRFGVRYLVTSAQSPVPGILDPPAEPAGQLALAPGKRYSVPLGPGALRGVVIGLAAPAVPTKVYAEVRSASGLVVAKNVLVTTSGQPSVSVALAGEDYPSDEPLLLDFRVDGPGLVAQTGADGALLAQAIRPPVKTDGTRLVFSGDGTAVWQRMGFVPRIHWASTVRVLPDATQRLAAVTSSPVVSGEVILASSPPNDYDNTTTPAAVTVLEDSGDTIKVRTEVADSGFLVVADSITDDFAASVDGQPTDIVSADYAGGAVYVERGTHVVVLTYNPRGRTVGAIISALSALLVLAAAAVRPWPVGRQPKRRARRITKGSGADASPR